MTLFVSLPQDGLNVDAELEVDLQYLSGRLLQPDLVTGSLARHHVGDHLMDGCCCFEISRQIVLTKVGLFQLILPDIS